MGSLKMMVSLKVTIVGVVVFLIACTVAGIWAPAATLATDALIEARKDQMSSNAYSTANRILGYFQTASSQINGIGVVWNLTQAGNSTEPAPFFLQYYARGIWTQLDNPALTSLSIRYIEDETSDCPVAGIILASSYVAMSGKKYDFQNGSDCPLDHVSCKPGYFRLNKIAGSSAERDPIEIVGTLDHFRCPSVPEYWDEFVFSGDQASLDTNVRMNVWQRPFVVGRAPNDAIYMQVRFPVAISKNPLSGFGGLGIRVGSSMIGGAGQYSLQNLLERAAAVTDLDDTLFLLTSRGLLAASSIKDQQVEVRDATPPHALQGLTTSDNASMVSQPIRLISKQILNKYCGGYNCPWDGFAGRLEQIDDYRVAIAPINDPRAASLDFILVMVVHEAQITDPAKQLNVVLAITSCTVLLICACLTVALGRFISAPVVAFSEQIHKSSLMDLSNVDLSSTSFVTEIQKMNESLVVLVEHLTLYKSFLPEMLLNNTSDDECSFGTKTTFSDAASADGVVLARRVIPQGAKRKNGTVLATNVRGWNKAHCNTPLEAFEKHQISYITMLTKLASGGTLDYVNGDRATISFLKVPSVGISSACTGSLALRAEGELATNLVVGIAHGKLTFGVMGVAAYRSMQLCGHPLTVAHSLTTTTGSRTSHELAIIVDSNVVTNISSRFSFIASGIIAASSQNRGSKELQYTKYSDLLSPITQGLDSEWMYCFEDLESNRMTFKEFDNLLYQQALSPSEEHWAQFKAVATNVLLGNPDLPCACHIRTISNDPEAFADMCVLGRRRNHAFLAEKLVAEVEVEVEVEVTPDVTTCP